MQDQQFWAGRVLQKAGLEARLAIFARVACPFNHTAY